MKKKERPPGQRDKPIGWYSNRYLTDPDQVPFCWSDSDAENGPGQFWAPGGISLGDLEHPRPRRDRRFNIDNRWKIIYGKVSAPPNPHPTDPHSRKWRHGDIIFNKSPHP